MLEALYSIWIFCGVLSYGFFFAFLEREYPHKSEKEYTDSLFASLIIGFFGVLSLACVILGKKYKYGFKLY